MKNHNSSGDYMMITPGTHSLDNAPSPTASEVAAALSRSQSVSLDSVFTASSSGTVHLLNNAGMHGNGCDLTLLKCYLLKYVAYFYDVSNFLKDTVYKLFHVNIC